MDVSEPEHFPLYIPQENIVEIYDHHFGFEEYWKNKIGVNSKIEPVGACATLIWEEYCKRGNKKNISSLSANLLALAIVSNTLNFKATITKERDRQALASLENFITLERNWIANYFNEQTKDILSNIKTAINGDKKIQKIPNLSITVVIGQLELWEAGQFITDHQKEIKKILSDCGEELWFMSCPSISEGINYFYTNNLKIKDLLTSKLEAKFDGDIGKTPRLWMRKEILQRFYS